MTINYNWFYSALSQSLAALIGIVGMFVVYRLQIQDNRINDAVRKLQDYMSFPKPNELFSLTEKETIERADKGHEGIEDLERNIKFNREIITTIGKRLKEKSLTEEEFKRHKSDSLSIIERHERRIASLNERKNMIVTNKDHRFTIKWSAFFTILWLIVTFCLSLIGLMRSNYFLQYSHEGYFYTVMTILFLLGAILLLIMCCMLSLDIGIPDTIEYFKSRKKK